MAIEDMKQYQFKKGHLKLGGRKKGSLNYNTRLDKKLKQKTIDIDENGNQIKQSNLDHVLDGFIRRGKDGDPRVAELLHKWFEANDPMNIILTLSQMTNEQLQQIADGKVPNV